MQKWIFVSKNRDGYIFGFRKLENPKTFFLSLFFSSLSSLFLSFFLSPRILPRALDHPPPDQIRLATVQASSSQPSLPSRRQNHRRNRVGPQLASSPARIARASAKLGPFPRTDDVIWPQVSPSQLDPAPDDLRPRVSPRQT